MVAQEVLTACLGADVNLQGTDRPLVLTADAQTENGHFHRAPPVNRQQQITEDITVQRMEYEVVLKPEGVGDLSQLICQEGRRRASGRGHVLRDKTFCGPRDEGCPVRDFTDTDAMAGYHDGVRCCVENGLINGCADGTFRPDQPLSRAQLAQTLYNREGRSAVSGNSPFADVADDAWCAGAVIWASRTGIVDGYGNGLSGPGDPVTRQQLAAILWRYAQSKGYDVSVGEDTNILGFLAPTDRATRAQTAMMLQRFGETVEKCRR